MTSSKSPLRNSVTPQPTHHMRAPNSVGYGQNIRTPYGYHTIMHPIDPLSLPPPPRMRFQPHVNNYQVSPRHNASTYAYTGTNSIVPSPKKEIKTSPSQSGTIARARTAAPLSKTSPKLLKSNTSVSKTPIHNNETQNKTQTSPIDLTDSNSIDLKKRILVIQKPLTPSGRMNMSLPIPQLSVITNINKSVVIKWSLTKEQNITIVANYEIKGHQSNENVPPPPPTEWKRIGMVQAMSPPMACTLRRIGNGKRYSFVVRSIDHSGCHGQFSDIHTIQV